ncbi:MAG: thiolase family protein [Sulfobacillus sp.]
MTIHVVDGARTPFGRFMGGLKRVSAVDLGAIVARTAVARAEVDPQRVGAVVFGNVIQSSADAVYLARHVALRAGLPVATPALTVNRLCGSGLQAVVSAAQALLGNEAEWAVAGGTESMSQAPHVLRGTREGWGLGGGQVGDSLWDCLTDVDCGCSMAETAENIADDLQISRQEQDEFSLLSHQRALAARERFAAEIVPVGEVTEDEHPRLTSVEKLASLKPAFRQGGRVTAGNASGINDGASAVVLTTDAGLKAAGRPALGAIRSWAVVGVDPTRMGLGPVGAIELALARAHLAVTDIDLFEVNEAFAAQYLGVERLLGLPREQTNVNGGAIALGHPVGASGARLLLTLLYELRRRRQKLGVAALCIGGGQGIAMVVERGED